MAVAWQDSIRTALVARDVRERAFEPMIRDYSRLAHHARQLHDRNLALIDAATGARGDAANLNSPGEKTGTTEPANAAVRAALISRLESELATARSELSDAYKLQSQHSQRLLALSEQLHASDERARADREQLSELKTEVERLREGAKWHKEVVSEKEKQLVILQDELHSIELELSQLELQNDNLKTDNASLLQRWIAAKTEEARMMNEANAFLEEAKRIRAEIGLGKRKKDPKRRGSTGRDEEEEEDEEDEDDEVGRALEKSLADIREGMKRNAASSPRDKGKGRAL